MDRILGFVTSRWLISLVGVSILMSLIWYLGPLISVAGVEPLSSSTYRFIAIGIVALCWLIIQLWKYFRAKRQNSQIMEGLTEASSPSAEEQASTEELQTLQERLQEALSILKKTRLGGQLGRQFLYQLPWYIIIGPPGAGKTTLLKNSNLKFPLANRFGDESIRGIGGTRNCDWWFAEEAVLLDTAGRYVTQDSHETVDRAAWLGFLDLLKKYRRRRPINGVIIAISLADLLRQDEPQRQAHAKTIRQRIHELHEHFNIRMPVYLLFTKTDLLAGFAEYFDNLDRQGRAQVWGATFTLEDNANMAVQFELEFKGLEERLHQQLIEKLEAEHNGERRDAMYLFPQQFSLLRSLCTPFINEVFQPTRYDHPALLRGVYFTSATQEGSPVDRIMGTMARDLGLERQSLTSSGRGKSFFINRLLSEVIFAESGLAGTNLKLERKQAWLQRGSFVAVLALASLMAAIWLNSWIQNKAYIKEVAIQTELLQQATNELNSKQVNPLAVLPVLDKARHLPGGYASQDEGRPWSMSFGLYQGDKLGKAANAAYQKLLKGVFLPRLMIQLEQQMRDNASRTDYLYEALKVYLMLGDSEHYDKNAIHAWITLNWKRDLALTVSNEQRQALNQHLDALLENRPVPLPRPLDASLVQWVRNTLARVPLSERAYARLKLELANSQTADFRISEKAGREAPLVLALASGLPLNHEYPGLYTCAGYQQVFVQNNQRLTQKLTSENWVLGQVDTLKASQSQLQNLREDVLKRYTNDYIQQWDALLSDIQIRAFSTTPKMIEILNVLSSEPSPLKLLLVAVNQETSMACLVEPKKTVNEDLNAAEAALGNIIGQSSVSPASSEVDQAAKQIRNRFEPLRMLVQGSEGSSMPLDSSLALLNELAIHSNSFHTATGDMKAEQGKEVARVIDKIKRAAMRDPFPVNEIFNEIGEGSKNITTGGIRNHWNTMWQSEVLSFCQQAIQGRYPINANSSQEITYEDFTHFFAPGGLMNAFFNKYLTGSVEKSRRGWRSHTRGNASAGISSAALRQFQRADAIKNTFFRMGRQSPVVSFMLKPISMSVDINQFNLDIDGQSLNYAHGPLRAVPMKWPGPDGSGQVRIQLSPPLGGGGSGLTREGPWALFRLFDKAQLTRTTSSELFILTFNIQGREAKFELRAGSAVNPFQSSILQSFSCPRNL